ncbi:MAG: PA2779 family protein [Deltaproteobacteria bacterium]|nr:PA2779 family protein [Deltaproteobacteria bacterium]
MTKPFLKCVSWYLVVAMFILGAVPNVYAGLSPSEVINISGVDRASDLQSIQNILEMKMVAQRLNQIGFTKNEIQARLCQLDDDQIHRLALNLDDIKIGSGGFEVLVVVLLIGILIAVWLRVMGKKVIIQ